MYAIRTKRIAPETEQVVDTSWSAMMARGFIALYQVSDEEKYLQSAEKTVAQLLSPAKGENLHHLTISGASSDETFLDDYAEGIAAWVALFESNQNDETLQQAVSLTDDALHLFGDETNGGFWFTPHGQDDLLPRRKNFYESATQNAASLMTKNLLRLYALTGKSRYQELAARAITTSGAPNHSPLGAGTWYAAKAMMLNGLDEYVLVAGENSDEAEQIFRTIQKAALRNKVMLLLGLPRSAAPLAHKAKVAINGETTLYLCHNLSCDKPVAGAVAIHKVIESKTYKEDGVH